MQQDAWQHQVEGVDYGRGRQCCLYNCGMGTGKSRIALDVLLEEIAARAGNPLPFRALLGCPKAVLPAWGKQHGMWMPHVRMLILTDGTSATKQRQVAAALADTSPLIVAANYETLWRIKLLEATRWDAFVWDEIHRLKAASGAASKWAARMGKANPTAKRIGLSGTLLAHSPLDAYGVWRAIESPTCPTFGSNYTAFKSMYFIPHPNGIRGAVRTDKIRNEDMFARKIAATTFLRKSEDVLRLPPIMHEEVAFHLTPLEALAYRELSNEFIAEVGGGTVTPANAMVAALRLLQTCNGFAKLDGVDTPVQIDTSPSKATALREMLEDLHPNEPLVIFCRFRTDIESCLKVLWDMHRSASELSGRINSLADWQAGKTTVLVAQIQSGGIGIDLTRASYGVFYSLGHSLSEYLQAIARLHRPGQEKTTRFYSLVATLLGKKTVDGFVYEALSQRKEVIDAIIDAHNPRRIVNCA